MCTLLSFDAYFCDKIRDLIFFLYKSQEKFCFGLFFAKKNVFLFDGPEKCFFFYSIKTSVICLSKHITFFVVPV